MSDMNLSRIKKLFKNRTPGAIGRHSFFSVLVPLVEKDGKLHLLYEVRAEHMKRQPGEVCFPGGMVEEGESFQECAVRETVEELGISETDIRIISQMDTLHAYSNFTMFSFLGTIKEESLATLRLNREEVKEVFLVPLSYLADHDPIVYQMKVEPVVGKDFPYEKIRFSKGYNWRKGSTEVPIYEYENHVIWGLTGRITKNFIEVLKSQEAENV